MLKYFLILITVGLLSSFYIQKLFFHTMPSNAKESLKRYGYAFNGKK